MEAPPAKIHLSMHYGYFEMGSQIQNFLRQLNSFVQKLNISLGKPGV